MAVNTNLFKANVKQAFTFYVTSANLVHGIHCHWCVREEVSTVIISWQSNWRRITESFCGWLASQFEKNVLSNFFQSFRMIERKHIFCVFSVCRVKCPWNKAWASECNLTASFIAQVLIWISVSWWSIVCPICGSSFKVGYQGDGSCCHICRLSTSSALASRIISWKRTFQSHV